MIAIMLFSFSLIAAGSSFNSVLIKPGRPETDALAWLSAYYAAQAAYYHIITLIRTQRREDTYARQGHKVRYAYF